MIGDDQQCSKEIEMLPTILGFKGAVIVFMAKGDELLDSGVLKSFCPPRSQYTESLPPHRSLWTEFPPTVRLT